ncbi:MAG: S41 family peptidase, partial [Candidatus Eremiobacterota bacterium]
KPYHAYESFAGREGRDTRIRVRRQLGGPVRELAVVPARLDGGSMFLEAMRRSARVEVVDGVRVAYVRLWSYASDDYQEILAELVADRFASAEALVLDLRGGWGGASPEYLNLYNRKVPIIDFVGRNGRPERLDSQWRKPLVVLMDETSRSGKEILAFGVRRYGLGQLVGARTAGAVVFGRAYLLDSGNLLYLAVGDCRVDGQRLEGVGVEPDLPVEWDLPYSAGRDPQRKAALEAAARAARP